MSSAISKVYLIGFTYIRPGEPLPSAISELPEGKDWAFYRPPSTARVVWDSDDDEDLFDDSASSRITTAMPGTTAYDMYGLGIVLLEIGMWATAYNMSKNGKLETFFAQGLPGHIEKLGPRCGAIYQGVVRKCLTQRTGVRKLLQRILRVSWEAFGPVELNTWHAARASFPYEVSEFG